MSDQPETPAAAKGKKRAAHTTKAKAPAQTKEDIELQIAQTRLQREQLDLAEAQENNDRRIATAAQRARQNKQRQGEMNAGIVGRKKATKACTHRQGGSPGALNKGKGPTALNVVKMPDGFTKLIMCSICRLRVVNPHPRNKSTKIFKGETAAARDARVEKYNTDLAEYERIYELSRDGLTPESVQEMDCGVTMSITDDDGNFILRERPFDSNPLYM